MRGEKQLSREEVSGHVLNIEHYEKMLRVGIMQSRGSELDQASWIFMRRTPFHLAQLAGHLPTFPVWAVWPKVTVPACPASPKDWEVSAWEEGG